MKRNVPLATYRLQFNTNFQFRDAIGILDYLRELGISHIYASPVFTSRRGSGHGYDVTDPTRIDPDLGG
ncbi:MAG: alpha-amylase family glycosyl hydrolase [Candidatus Acidiferrales bacterium]